MRIGADGTVYDYVSPPISQEGSTFSTPTGSLTISKSGTVTPSGTPPATISPPVTPTPWQQFTTAWNQFISDFMAWMAKL